MRRSTDRMIGNTRLYFTVRSGSVISLGKLPEEIRCYVTVPYLHA